MKNESKEFCLEVWAESACFTRPEFKVERVSYEVITPSAAKGVFDAIFWKPAFKWQVTRIEVLNPIRMKSISRNEVGALAGKKPIYAKDHYVQRNALILSDVHYRIWAKQNFIEPSKREVPQDTSERTDETPKKYETIFERRASRGQCFYQPFLGCREFSAEFRLVNGNDPNLKRPITAAEGGTRDFGYMLYGLDYKDPQKPQRLLYRVKMENGVIMVPPKNSKEVLR